MKRLAPEQNRSLVISLNCNFVVLIGLIALHFLLPLSNTERWFLVLSAATLLGLNWCLLAYAAKGGGEK